MGKRQVSEKGHFNAQREITKYKLDHSTFDLIDVDRFHNTKFSTVIGYMWMWIMILLSWVLLGVDIYTCLNILVFHHWSTEDYKPYAYSVAKWIFTGCIIFQFCLLLYHWLWAIHTYRTRNIALAYVNSIARILYSVRSYNYYCLFHKIDTDNFFDFACFLAYDQMDNALQILVADTPRQVINILTLRYYATDGDLSNDIIANIKEIATTNVRLSIILSFMCLSVIIWSFFFFLFVAGMLCYIPVFVKVRNRGFKSLKKFCCKVVNDKVRDLVLKNHRPKNELLERGILDANEIVANPLLNDSQSFVNDFSYTAVPKGMEYNDNKKLYETYSLQDIKNPFQDASQSRSSSSDTLTVRSSGKSPFAQQSIPASYSVESFTNESVKNPFEDSSSRLVGTEHGDSASLLRSQMNESQTSLNYERRPPPVAGSQVFPIRSQTEPISRPGAAQRSQIQPYLQHNHSQTSVHTQPLPHINEPVMPRRRPPPRSESNHSLDSNAPYPVRGISLYDKNYRKVIQKGEEGPGKRTVYPLEETDEEKIKGVYPQGDILSSESEEERLDLVDLHSHSDSESGRDTTTVYPVRDVVDSQSDDSTSDSHSRFKPYPNVYPYD